MINKPLTEKQRISAIKKAVRKSRKKNPRVRELETKVIGRAPQEWDIQEELELMGTRLK